MQPYGRTPTTSDCKGLIQGWYLIKGNINMAQVPIPISAAIRQPTLLHWFPVAAPDVTSGPAF